MTDKTIVDVADKAVDKMSDGLAKVAAEFQKLAPQAWEALVRQQLIEGAVDLALSTAVAIAAAIILPRLWRRGNKMAAERDGLDFGADMLRGGLLIVGACVASSVLVEARESLLQLGNPQYYAAKALAEMVK